MLRDLAALTPPAVVCAAFLAGLALLLRREMAPKRSEREPADSEDDFSGNNDIIDVKASAPEASAGERDEVTTSRDGRPSPG